MIDSHCHLADEVFAADLEAVIARAREAGVTSALVVLDAASEEEAARAAHIEELWPEVRFATGVHPHHAGRFAADLTRVDEMVSGSLAVHARSRAVGEAGLDYHYDFAPRDVQQEVFRVQIALARQRKLPIVIHTREADEDTLRLLREEGAHEVRGVFHCFSSSEALARAALDLGFHISLAGIVTFPKAEAVRSVARLVPDDRVLVETDSPFLAPPPRRGKRNEPAHVIRIAEVVADARGVSLDALRVQTTGNFERLFNP
jgi:TatD DNase family protein